MKYVAAVLAVVALAYFTEPASAATTGHGARVEVAGGTAIYSTTNAWQNLRFDLGTEAYDTDAYHVAGSATITIPAGLGGTYFVGCSYRGGNSAVAHARLAVGARIIGFGMTNGNSATMSATAYTAVDLTAGDVVSCQGHSPTTATQASDHPAYFFVQRFEDAGGGVPDLSNYYTKGESDGRFCNVAGETEASCATAGGVSQEEFDDYVLASHTCGDPNADPPQDPCDVALGADDRQRLTDLRQLNGYAVGVLLVLVALPFLLGAFGRRWGS